MKKIFTFFIISTLFFACKKTSIDSNVSQTNQEVSVQEAKAFLFDENSRRTNSTNENEFNPSSLLSEIDWKNAS